MWDKRAFMLSEHDGDTQVAVLDQGFGDTKQITVRLFDTWAPELKQTGGPETRDFAIAWVKKYALPGVKWPFLVTTIRLPVADKEDITLARYVCIVETADHLHSLNTDVQAFVTANGYPGGTGS